MWTTPKPCAAVVCGVAVLFFFAAPGVLLAQARPAAPPWSALEDAIGKEDYTQARKLADAILRGGAPEDCLKTMRVYGRILLGLGQKDQARHYLAMVSAKDGSAAPRKKPSGPTPFSTNQRQLAIYAAWLKALDGKPDEAVRALQRALDDMAPDETTAEAADALAMIYMGLGEDENAKKSVDFGLKILEYRSTKAGYVLALLRGRLGSNIMAVEAKRLYDAAESLRAQGRFVAAGQLFAQIRTTFGGKATRPTSRDGAKITPLYAHAASHWALAASQWAQASGFRIGQCYFGLGRSSQALDWWQKFIKESPAGPWRGQAQVAIVDLLLKTEFDVARATEHAAAASAVLDQGADKEAAPSWAEAAYDIHLRQGILALIDGRFDAAGDALHQAQQSAGGRAAGDAAGLEQLLGTAQRRIKLVPGDLAGDQHGTVAVSLGAVYNVLHDYDCAETLFAVVLTGPTRSRSAAHRSFGELGLANALAADGQTAANAGASGLARAKTIFEASLKECPEGSWRDETLYRLATTIEEMAEATFGKRFGVTEDRAGRGPGQPAMPLGQGHRVQGDAQSQAALRRARGEALPHWRAIAEHYPESPHCEQACYRAGLLLFEMAEVAPAGQSENLWKDAGSMLSQLCVRFPKSHYAGDAYVRQIDIALERTFDISAAAALADLGIRWAKDQNVEVETSADGTVTRKSVADAAAAIKSAAAVLPVWRQTGVMPAESLLDDLYNLHYRAAIICYVQEKYEGVAEHVEAAGPARPSEGMRANFDLRGVGLHILKVCAERKTPAWDAEGVKAAKTENEKLALKLADTYRHSQRPDKAEAIYKRLLAGDSSLGRPGKALESYCLMQLAGIYSDRKEDRDKAIEYYKRFYQKDFASFPWAAAAIVRLAVLEYNTSHDPHRSIPHYQHVLKKYPKHPQAERALYFLALDAVQAGDKRLAESSCKDFIKRYPKSGWRNHIQSVLSDEVPKLKDKSEGEKR